MSSQTSYSSAFASSCSRVISIPACISPTVTADTKSCSAGAFPIQSTTAPCGQGRRNSETTLVSRRYITLLHGQRRSMAMLSARRRKVIGPCLRREEQLLQVRPGHPLQPPPLLDWKEHSSFDSTPGHDLWPFCESCIQQLAESRLGILNRPSPTHDSPHLLFV